ncbi:phage tail tube protein [Halorhabdus amylolytica]|uniref:phage tail tube protein n=1 Tax=Halorhabdus amylolytica TaxID=2559573 RepID=UPI0010AAF798|nr:phage tail tube protein [Halorhabdus amylolytica]
MVSGVNTEVAYLHEPVDDYTGTPTDSDYKIPGIGTTVEELAIDNALQRIRVPNAAQAAETVAGNFEGAFNVNFTLGNPWWLNHVFGGPPEAGGESDAPYTYTWDFETDRVQSSRWYIGANFYNNTVERVLKGVVFGGLQVQCQVGETVQVDLTGFYGDEERNSSITPGSTPDEQANPLVFHGATLEVPSSSELKKLQDFTVDIQTGARPVQGMQRKPHDAVMGAVETELSVNEVLTETDQLALAYGNSNAPVNGRMDGAADGTVRFDGPPSGNTAIEFQMTGVKPNDYSWNNVGNAEENLSEAITYYVNKVSALAESSQDTAR